jgi:hypothetical protein
LRASVLLCACLAFAISACRKGGGPACPAAPPPIGLTADDGTPAGELRVAAVADGLNVEFRPADGRPFEGDYLIGTPDGEFRYAPESSGEGLLIPWDGLADDPCGRTFTVAVGTLAAQAVPIAVDCAAEAATGTGGDTNGGPNCPQ